VLDKIRARRQAAGLPRMMKKVLLVPELVPESSWCNNLRSELERGAWDVLRKEVYRLANYRCEICGGRGEKWPVECHEVWEFDEGKGVQRLVRLEGICPACHEVKHIGLAEVRGRYEAAMGHLCKVNGCGRAEGERIVEKAFDDWGRRSEMEWKLDLSFLAEFRRG
jgi:hypothetical protein